MIIKNPMKNIKISYAKNLKSGYCKFRLFRLKKLSIINEVYINASSVGYQYYNSP